MQTGQLIGVSSFVLNDTQGYYCDQAPAIFTRVGSYIFFINKNLGASGYGGPETQRLQEAPKIKDIVYNMYKSCERHVLKKYYHCSEEVWKHCTYAAEGGINGNEQDACEEEVDNGCTNRREGVNACNDCLDEPEANITTLQILEANLNTTSRQVLECADRSYLYNFTP